jgi:dipeptidase E
MEALLLSASRVGDTGFLEHAIGYIKDFIGESNKEKTLNVVFVPFAGVTIEHGQYTEMFAKAVSSLNLNIINLSAQQDKQQAILEADVIAVGGGNTFQLLNQLYQFDLINLIRQQVEAGTKYIGWSAGSNIAGLSIKTTNDMPIVQPTSFEAIGLIPYQINPHYTDYQPPGHNGETREMRLQEFMVLSPNVGIIGIQEGTGLRVSNGSITLFGEKEGYYFLTGQKSVIEPNTKVA